MTAIYTSHDGKRQFVVVPEKVPYGVLYHLPGGSMLVSHAEHSDPRPMSHTFMSPESDGGYSAD